ncbi:MAG: VWA domain-containing protein [Gemmatimonadaceae bacterium]|nr:VWA domain-containing protein [Gemmatimonadaceae bacterium]
MRHTLTLDYRPLPDGAGHLVRALLELQGVPAIAATRAPLRLSIVLDRSGSMAGAPLAAATQAAVDLVRRLAPDDVVSVVSFDEHVETAVPPHRGGGEAGVTERILAIEARGSTNLSGGWLRGRDLAGRDRVEGGAHRVVLLTDGQANAGITDPGRLAELAREARAQGITTTCVGFGAEYDESLLRAMADAGGGNCFHIERPDQAALAFGDELDGLQSLAGQNLQVVVALGDAVQLARVHHDWPCSDGPDGRTFDLGDLYAREPKRLLIEFVCAPPGAAAGVPSRAIARITVRADVREADGGMAHVDVSLPVAATLDGAGEEAPVIRREVLLTAAAQARAAAADLVRRGAAREAGRTLRAMRDRLEASPDAPLFAREATDLEVLARRCETDEATEEDARYLMQRSYNARRGKASYDAGFVRPEGRTPRRRREP